ncbi:hypothetical protein [Nodularia sphaerocarpa]|uniref:sunset domain-containing protein n=1 Tax=Nodularia sphaerocarpa TaxID=137816 RepID=UPI001EFA3F5E|nr:hypothetical protein [Nodularia sphaerocarpa]MDB9374964.1 hypothetical protein [Nodularia sphaerocarpa CS-585]MDB9380580.1 hypothetical protein [Nodularia sphaerocarpa CS-585A2]ULP73159.1 hypothetical protein BDGGKGIB_02812 [Nodularia sphaerocarpa UHCC 0038]
MELLNNKALLGTVVIMGILVVVSLSRMKSSPSASGSLVTAIKKTDEKSECNIKGNISIKTGRKIYHLPGMEYYESTVINPASGERWFCTESEAIANGWRKSRR